MFTLEAAPARVSPFEEQSAEALFREAKQRARRRRLGIAAAIVAGLLVVGGIIWSVGGNSGNSAVKIPRSQPAFGQTVMRATTAPGGANFSAVWRDTITGGCVPDTNTAVLHATGSIDFATQTVGFKTVMKGCGDIQEYPSVVITPSAYYTQVVHYTSTAGGRIERAKATTKWGKSTNLWEGPSYQWSISSLLTSPRVVSTVTAIEGPIVKGGRSNIGGVGVTEYSGTASLAALESLDPNVTVEPAGQLLPAASSIVMKVRLWIDDQGRLVRLSMVEPLFTGINHDGSDFEEAAQVPSSVAIVKQQSARQITVTLSDLGTKVVRTPAASAIASSK